MNLRQKLSSGAPVLGTFAFLADPTVVEIMALAGLDFVIVDMEHSPTDWETVANMVRAAEARAIAPLVRVGENNDKLILRALETGAEGIVVPFLQTAEDARRAGLAVRYPPEGIRGTCTVSRSSRYGAVRSRFGEHMRRRDESVVLVGLLEDMKAVENIAEMVRVSPGPDVFLVGRADLASTLGASGAVGDERVMAATQRIIDAVLADEGPGRAAGIGLYRPDEAAEWLAKGCRFFTYSVDNLVLLSGYQNAVEAYTKAKASTPSRRGGGLGHA